MNIIPILATDKWVLYGFKGVVGNCYILEDHCLKATFLFDCGMPSDARFLLSRFQPEFPLQAIFCTHFHIDHTAGWSVLKTRFPECTLWFHKLALPVISGMKRLAMPSRRDCRDTLIPCMKESHYFPDIIDIWKSKLYGTPFRKGFPLDRINFFKTGSLLPSGFEVLHTPGHSADSVSFYEPESGILLCGDLMLGIRGKLAPIAYVENPVAQQQSIQDVSRLNPLTMMGPGHGRLYFNRNTPHYRRLTRSFSSGLPPVNIQN